MRIERPVAFLGLPVLLLFSGWRVHGVTATTPQAALEPERYTLVQVNGRPLPFLLYAVEDDCEADLVAGTLEVDPARGRYLLLERVREECAWSGPDEVETREGGRYEVGAREIRFRSDHERSPSWPGWTRGSTLELVRGGRAYTYRR